MPMDRGAWYWRYSRPVAKPLFHFVARQRMHNRGEA